MSFIIAAVQARVDCAAGFASVRWHAVSAVRALLVRRK